MASGVLQFMPKGFRFQPTNKEVFDHFLSRKNHEQEDFSAYVPDINVTTLDPWELPDKYKVILNYQRNEKEWWFFSPRTRNQRAERKTRSGWWGSTCKDKKILDGCKNQPLGIMKTFAFHRGSRSSSTRDNWILHEYHLSNLPLPNETYFVLCCLNKNDDRAENNTGGEVGHPGLSGIDQQEVRQRNREISSQAPPSKRPKEPTDAPSGPVHKGPDLTKLDDDIYGCLEDLPAPNNSQVLTFESSMLLVDLGEAQMCSGFDSLESSGEDDPAEGKKASVENRNAKPRPPSLVSPSTVAQPKGFKASRVPALLFPKARVVKEELTAASPLRYKISIEKVEAGEKLMQETEEKSRPKLKCESQDPLTRSAKSLGGVGPAEGKKESVKNRNAKPQPSSPVSPSAQPQSFKASNSSANAKSYPKARAPMGKPTAANPLAKETKEKSRPKSKCEIQDPSTLPPSKNSTDAVMEKFSRLELQDKKKERKKLEGTRESRIDRELCK